MPYALPKQAYKHERELCEAMRDAGSARKLKNRQIAFTRSGAVKMVAARDALWRLRVEVTEEILQSTSQKMDLWRPCTEPVQIHHVLKSNGQRRRVVKFGPVRRALDFMVRRMLLARFTPHPGQYALEGRGRDQACIAIAKAISQEERRWIVLSDITNAYGSVDMEQALSGLPIPKPISRYHLTAPPGDTSFGTDEYTGLPQGAAASNVALAMVLQPLLEQLPSTAKPFLYVDDFCGLCSTEAAAAELLDAFQQALTHLPGQFVPKHLYRADACEGFTFLGYEFRLTKSGTVDIRISDEAFERLYANCDFRAYRGDTQEQIDTYVEEWKRSYGLSNFTPEEQLMVDLTRDAWRMVNQQRFGSSLLRSNRLSPHVVK